MEAAGGGYAPSHGWCAVGEAEAAVGAEEDDASVAAEAVVEIGDCFAGGDFRCAAGGDAVGGPLAEHEFHDGLAPTGEGDSGGEVVSVAAAADEGGVAHAAGCFVECAACGGGCGKVAVGVECDCADCIVPLRGAFDLPESEGCLRALVVEHSAECFIGEACGLACLCCGEAGAFAVEDELGVIDERHAVGVSELFGAGTDEVDVRALFEDEARGVNRVAEAFDAGYATGFHAATIHEESVELHAAIGGEETAETGVEGGIIFENGDGGFYGIDC